MNIVLVDDQPIETRLLTKYISKYSEESNIDNINISTFHDASLFLDSFSEGAYYIAFLDILMDGMNGIELARKIRAIDSEIKIVFCTSTNEFATESYEVNASQYLLKPYTYDNLKMVLRNVLPKQNITNLSILLNDGQRIIPRNILYTEYFNHKITIHCKVGEDISVRYNQNDFEQLFTDFNYIVPCNRGLLVNMYEVKKISESSIILCDNTTLPISRSRLNDVKNIYEKFLYEKIKNNYS